MLTELYQEFQEAMLSDDPNYMQIIPTVIAAGKKAEGLERVQLASLERLVNALRDFNEKRGGLSDLSVLIRQYIRFHHQKLYIQPDLWRKISSRAQEFHLWGLPDPDGKSVEIGVHQWKPDWLSGAENIDRPMIRRNESLVMGDGLLFSATGMTTYLSQAQKNAVLACLTLPPGDTLLISLPTGAGKSLCILLPAWQDSHGGRKAGGSTLVVVPTVALAYDQEIKANENFTFSLNDHYKPWSLTGATLPQNRAIIREGLKDGSLPLLFTSPESLLNSEIYDICLEAAGHGHIKRMVIDEAHIVESWGADFRAEFQYLATFRRNLLKNSATPPSTILLSATISDNCEKDLKTLFGVDNRLHVLRGSSLRSEIAYWFAHSESRELRKKRVLEAIFHLPRPMILFVNKPAEAQAWVEDLRERGFYRIAAFSGNTDNAERERILSGWSKNHWDLIVATSAFGLGVDKADVRTIIHAAFPESIDRFYQEVGRSGRDGISSISLMCTAAGDWDEAFHIIKTSRITTKKALSRWEGMCNCAKITPPREMVVDLNAKPRYNPDLAESERHRDWNIHVLLMMQRAGLIRITDTRIERSAEGNPSAGGIETDVEEMDNSFLIRLEILDPAITNDSKRLEKQLDKVRKEEVFEVRGGLDKLAEMVYRFTTKKAKLCISRTLADLYPAVSIACGGCPVCREEEHKPYPGYMTIKMDLLKTSLDWTKVDPWLRVRLSAHHTFNVYWEGVADLEHFKNKNEFFAGLIKKGVGQFILPDNFFNDPDWVREACSTFSEQDQVIHQILPYQSIRNMKKHLFLPVPTVILYPDKTREADDLWKELEEFFPAPKEIPRINIVQRGLRLPSLSGLFIDKVNGLNESFNQVEEAIIKQADIIDF